MKKIICALLIAVVAWNTGTTIAMNAQKDDDLHLLVVPPTHNLLPQDYLAVLNSTKAKITMVKTDFETSIAGLPEKHIRENLLEHIEQTLKTNNQTKFIICGIEDSSPLALEAATRYPKNITATVLIDPTWSGDYSFCGDYSLYGSSGLIKAHINKPLILVSTDSLDTITTPNPVLNLWAQNKYPVQHIQLSEALNSNVLSVLPKLESQIPIIKLCQESKATIKTDQRKLYIQKKLLHLGLFVGGGILLYLLWHSPKHFIKGLKAIFKGNSRNITVIYR